MTKRRKQLNFLSVSKGGGSSRFVVDLKKHLEEREEIENKELKKTYWLWFKSGLFTYCRKFFLYAK